MYSQPADIARHPTYGADFQAVYREARRRSLPEADCQDCAVTFVVQKLERGASFSQDDALRRRCAHDFVCDFCRARARRAQHELPACPDFATATRGATTRGLEEEVIRQAFWQELHPFLHRLQPMPRQIVQRHYQNGETVSELAADFGKTPHAIEALLSRSRQRLQTLLKKAGIDAAELYDYLTP